MIRVNPGLNPKQTLHHEVMQAWGAVNELRQH